MVRASPVMAAGAGVLIPSQFHVDQLTLSGKALPLLAHCGPGSSFYSADSNSLLSGFTPSLTALGFC